MKKRYLILIISILIMISICGLIYLKFVSNSKSIKSTKNIKEIEVQSIGDFNSGLAIFKQNNKYGFINKKGDIVIEPTFTLARSFNDGFALVCKEKDKCGYIDNKGKTIIDFKYDYGNLFYNEEKESIYKSKVKDNLIIVYKDSKKAIFDTTGKQLIPFDNTKELLLSKDGIITTSNDSFTYKLVDTKNNRTIIEEPYMVAGYCSNNMCVIGKQMTKNLNEKFTYGYIDYNGNLKIEYKYDAASYFNKNGIALVKIGQNVGLINKEGKYIVEPTYYYWDASYAFYNTDSIEEGFILSKDDYKIIAGFDSNGKKIFEFNTNYRIKSNFSNGYALLYKENEEKDIVEQFYMNKNGEIVLGPYESCRAFSDGLAFIKENNKYYYINKKGEKVIEVNFLNSNN